jgi:hypothetical protein
MTLQGGNDIIYFKIKSVEITFRELWQQAPQQVLWTVQNRPADNFLMQTP